MSVNRLSITSSISHIDVDPTKPIDMKALMRQLLDEPDVTEPVKEMKKCVRCRRTKLARHFPKHEDSNNLANSTCHACTGSRNAQARRNSAVHNTPGRKRCPKCCELKSVTDFHKHRGTLDGLQTQCKACKRETSRRYLNGKTKHG